MKFQKKKAWFMALLMGCFIPALAQETIWSEDFDMQTDGLDNGNYGPITSANGKWNLAVINQGGTWTGTSDYVKVNNDLIEARDTDNRCEWSSVAIDISAHSNVTVSIDMSESGNHEVTDTLAAYYVLDGGALTTFDTNGINVDDFTSLTATSSIPAGNTLQVYVHLKNNSGSEYLTFDNVLVSGTLSGGTTTNSEPTDHVSAIGFTSITSSGFTVNWTDSSSGDLPSGYLVKISEGLITDPVDLTAEADAEMVLNVAQGIQTASFSSLSANTTYNVAIYPYSNSGATIDYKLAPAIHQSTTEEPPAASVVFISEIADPDNDSNGRFVELYNNSSNDIDLSSWKLQCYTNATGTASSPLALSGTIAAYSTFVIGKSSFEGIYGFAPDLVSSNIVVDSNGDDNIELLNASEATADIFGVPGEDGTGTNHEFEDGRAERNANVTSGNSIYTASEWTIDSDSGAGDGEIDAPGGFDPGEWIGAPVQFLLTTNSNEDNYQLASGETLTISNGAVLTISNGGQLEGTVTVESGAGIEITSGTLDNMSELILEDGAFLYENGGLLNSTGTCIVKRNTTLNTNAFNFLSSPVASPDLQAVLVGSNVISYNPTNFVSDGMGDVDNFTAWEYHTSGTLGVGRGYAVSGSQTDNSGVRSFSGTPNSGTYSLAVLTSNHSNPNGESWNLVGNPYPSPIQIGDFLATNTATIENGVYLWDNSIDDYVTKNSGMNGGELIAIGQGFFVQAKTDDNISYTNSMRRGNSAAFFKKAKPFVLELVLTDQNGKKNFTSIAMSENALDEKDSLFDSKKMFGNNQLSIYSLLSGDAHAIQGVSNKGSKQIPIGVRTDSAGIFDLTIKISADITNCEVLIEDRLLNEITPIHKNSLQVALEEGIHDQRFVLHIKNVKKPSNGIVENEISYTFKDGVIAITNENCVKISLSDMTGRLIREYEGSNVNVNDLPHGTYLMQVESIFGIQYKKITL